METFFAIFQKDVDILETMCYYVDVAKMETRKEGNMTNSNKLKGRIVEMGYTITGFSDAAKISRPCFRNKINGRSEFKASEIERICNLLEISYTEISDYFFTSSVPVVETKRTG